MVGKTVRSKVVSMSLHSSNHISISCCVSLSWLLPSLGIVHFLRQFLLMFAKNSFKGSKSLCELWSLLFYDVKYGVEKHISERHRIPIPERASPEHKLHPLDHNSLPWQMKEAGDSPGWTRAVRKTSFFSFSGLRWSESKWEETWKKS